MVEKKIKKRIKFGYDFVKKSIPEMSYRMYLIALNDYIALKHTSDIYFSDFLKWIQE